MTCVGKYACMVAFFWVLETTLEVTVEKKLSGLGFTFLISDISPREGSVVRIKKLFSGQSSEESSPLREGDVILMVNGESVKGLSYQVLCSYTLNIEETPNSHNVAK